MERRLDYDKTTRKILARESINYGIIYGNEKIVFIKVGADGSIRGYLDKYLRMAHRVHERIGATVICASNPYIECGHVEADQSMIFEVASAGGFVDYEVYFAGVSDGGYHNLLLAQQMPQARKLLGVNASLIDEDDFIENLHQIPYVEKILVYGAEDDNECVSALQALGCEKLKIVTVAGADHDFTGMVNEFIALIDLI